MFFIDKYAPISPDKSLLHKDILKLLKFISNDDSIPHIIFYGASGVGKKKIIKLFLEMLYGADINKTEEYIYNVCGSGNKVKDVLVKQSDFHIVIDPVDNNFDKYLIQDIVKEYAKRIQINLFGSKKLFKSVLINNLDNLSYYAQTSLRRTMEKYSGTCRFIMWCNSLSQVIEPLKSRCICIRVEAPSNQEMFKLAYTVAMKEDIDLKFEDYDFLIKNANGSIKMLLWSLNLMKVKNTTKNIYQDTIEKICDLIILSELFEIGNIRALIYNLIITNIEPNIILRDILINLCKNPDISEEKKIQIINNASKYDHCIVKKRREILHFDAFVIDVMNVLDT